MQMSGSAMDARAAPTDIGRAIFISVVAWVVIVGAVGLLALTATGFR